MSAGTLASSVLQSERQAGQRAMQIERRQRVAARDDRGDAFEPPARSIFSSGCTSSTTLAPARASTRRVARKHHGVAQALLGVQQNGLARERGVAEPQRLAEILRGPMPVRFQRHSYSANPRV